MAHEVILVTGGSGFIGSNLVRALVRSGRRVVVSDWLRKPPKALNLLGVQVEKIVPPEWLGAWLKNYGHTVDAVVHLGAKSSTDNQDGDEVIHTNLTLSQDLAGWAKETGTRFIYASSAATYGHGFNGLRDEKGFDDDPRLLPELEPLSLYAWSKHAFDRWLWDHGNDDNRPEAQCVGLKFFNVYGPGEGHKKQPSPFVQWVTRGHFVVYKHPSGMEMARDFVHITDAVRVLMWFVANPEASGLYNVGTGEAVTWPALAELVHEKWPGHPAFSPTYELLPEEWLPRYQTVTKAHTERLKDIGAPVPPIPVRSGVPDYLLWLEKGRKGRCMA